VTDLPVSLAAPVDLHSGEFVLRVQAAATVVDHNRKTIELAITPTRAGARTGDALKSSVSFVKVRNDWIVQGPVDAFAKLLAGPRKLRKPVRSDS